MLFFCDHCGTAQEEDDSVQLRNCFHMLCEDCMPCAECEETEPEEEPCKP